MLPDLSDDLLHLNLAWIERHFQPDIFSTIDAKHLPHPQRLRMGRVSINQEHPGPAASATLSNWTSDTVDPLHDSPEFLAILAKSNPHLEMKNRSGLNGRACSAGQDVQLSVSWSV